MKMCNVCQQEKSLDDFHKKTNAKDGRQTVCKECNKAKVKEWQGHSAKYREYVKDRDNNASKQFARRAKKYGLTVDELLDMIDGAENKCKICKRNPVQWLVVDHCHKTNIVRGLLCEKCNQALGLLDDNPEYLESAIKYLASFA
jgi:protein-arginine kinase activator protein McsA